MKDEKSNVYYAEWDKCMCEGEIYYLVIVPTMRVAFIIKKATNIEEALYESGIRYKVSLTRNRDISKDIGTDEILTIVNRQGLTLPDEDIPVISFPSRLVQLFLV